MKILRPRQRKREPELFLNRELSWLAFNERVLEEARDPTNPLVERMKFATIAASNLDEFFMVRVAALKHHLAEGDTTPDPAGLTPAQQLERIAERVHAMVHQLYGDLSRNILPGIAEHGVSLVRLADLSDTQRAGLRRFFRAEVLPALTPLAIDASRPFPMLAGLSLNMALLLAPGDDAPEPRLAVVPVPTRLPRLVRATAETGISYVLIEDVLRSELAALFPGQEILHAATFRIARDAEMELDDEGGEDYVAALEDELRKRRRSQAVRLEVDAEVDSTLLDLLMERVEVGDDDVYRVEGPLDIRALSTFLDLPALSALRDVPLKPVPAMDTAEMEDVFATLDESDVFLSHPYDGFDPVVSFVRQAADDPDVLAIKMTLYRVGGDSPIVRALGEAAERGKQVTVLVELMARFDEQTNIRWARSLEEAGAHVIYGIRGYKTHAKICLVVRRGRQGIARYVHLSTGNYNDRTARLYTDCGLLTSDAEIGEDASAFFNALTGYSDPPRMKKLFMAPTTMRERILKLIARERQRAEGGQPAEIRAKMNSLVDEDIIRALYEASQTGVRIRLNVRGICCLRPGLKGVSERIEVVSIVDRFLEHTRAVHFLNGGEHEVYLSSADWMPRNLDRRIELLFPVESAGCKRRILSLLDTLFQDNVKARMLQPDGTYRRRRPARGEDPLRAQILLHREAVQLANRARAAAGVTFEPLGAPEKVEPR